MVFSLYKHTGGIASSMMANVSSIEMPDMPGVDTYTHIHGHIHTHTWTHTHTYMDTYTHIHKHIFLCVWISDMDTYVDCICIECVISI